MLDSHFFTHTHTHNHDTYECIPMHIWQKLTVFVCLRTRTVHVRVFVRISYICKRFIRLPMPFINAICTCSRSRFTNSQSVLCARVPAHVRNYGYVFDTWADFIFIKPYKMTVIPINDMVKLGRPQIACAQPITMVEYDFCGLMLLLVLLFVCDGGFVHIPKPIFTSSSCDMHILPNDDEQIVTNKCTTKSSHTHIWTTATSACIRT